MTNLSLLVGLNSEGTFNLGVLMPSPQSINVHIATDRNTEKSATVPRTWSVHKLSSDMSLNLNFTNSVQLT